MYSGYKFDSQLDLKLERIIDIKPEQVWQAWTNPDLLKKWFCPRPWQTVECAMDLFPGGKFYTVMQGPEGQQIANTGCFLEIIPNRKLVWTAALLPGFRPIPKPANGANLLFSAIIIIEPHPSGSKYTAIAVHQDEEGCNLHRQMGFHEGWGAALDQLLEVAKEL